MPAPFSSRARLTLLGLAAAVALAACGPGSSGGMGPRGGMDGMDGGMHGAPGDQAPGERPEAIPGATEVVIEAGDMFFDPDTIRATAGEPINITVANSGRTFHDLTIEELGFRLELPAGDTVTGGLTVDRPGEYGFVCTVPGHARAGMTGTLVVTD